MWCLKKILHDGVQKMDIFSQKGVVLQEHLYTFLFSLSFIDKLALLQYRRSLSALLGANDNTHTQRFFCSLFADIELKMQKNITCFWVINLQSLSSPPILFFSLDSFLDKSTSPSFSHIFYASVFLFWLKLKVDILWKFIYCFIRDHPT